VGRAEGVGHGLTEQYLQLVDRLSGRRERSRGLAGEGTGEAGGRSEERGGGGEREKG
jgi:hypothetical protein